MRSIKRLSTDGSVRGSHMLHARIGANLPDPVVWAMHLKSFIVLFGKPVYSCCSTKYILVYLPYSKSTWSIWVDLYKNIHHQQQVTWSHWTCYPPSNHPYMYLTIGQVFLLTQMWDPGVFLLSLCSWTLEQQHDNVVNIPRARNDNTQAHTAHNHAPSNHFTQQDLFKLWQQDTSVGDQSCTGVCTKNFNVASLVMLYSPLIWAFACATDINPFVSHIPFANILVLAPAIPNEMSSRKAFVSTFPFAFLDICNQLSSIVRILLGTHNKAYCMFCVSNESVSRHHSLKSVDVVVWVTFDCPLSSEPQKGCFGHSGRYWVDVCLFVPEQGHSHGVDCTILFREIMPHLAVDLFKIGGNLAM